VRTRATFAIVGLLAGAACGPTEREGGPPVAGGPAPPLEAVSLAGDTVSLKDLRGSPVLLNLWATWCTPCRKETPYLQELHERFGERGLQVVGVSVDSRSARRDVDDFVEEFGVTYRILHDPEMRSMDMFSVLGLPATYLIDRGGRIRWRKIGPIVEGDPDFEGAIASLVDTAGPS